MSQIDRNKLIKMIGILALIFMIVGMATHFRKKNSMTLEDYAKLHEDQTLADATAPPAARDDADMGENAEENRTDGAEDDGETAGSEWTEGTEMPEDITPQDTETAFSVLTGALLNGGLDGTAMLEQRVTYGADDASSADFYCEPLSENLRRYITGVSYPAEADPTPAITCEELRYLHILHYNFDGRPTEGELICNAGIAQDLLEIFYELYRNEYQIEKVLLIDEYDGDDTASMEDNNTSCFNYRVVEGSDNLSKHALGLALDINPLYNPYITYNKDGSQNVSPAAGQDYADRKLSFPYKIDENDLCFKLFTEHGFIWGGNWNSVKDYQHFQKAL